MKSAYMTSLALLALGTMRIASAQIGPLLDPPLPPSDLSPATGSYPADPTAPPPLILMWGQFFPSGGGLFLYPPATHFVVCFDPFVGGAAPPACTLASADYTETIAAPSSALTRSGSRFTLNPGRLLTAAEINQPLRLTVGACSVLIQRSCRFTSTDIFYASVNLIAKGTGEKATKDPKFDLYNWTLDVRVNNSGATESPQFAGTVEYWEVLGRGSPGRTCETNVDDPLFRNDNTLVAFDHFGTQTLVPSLPRPNGFYSGPPIQGMYRLGSAYDGRSFVTRDPAIGPLVSNSRAVADVIFPIPQASGQRTFVVLSRLDVNGVVREANESDNVWAQCKKR